MDGRLSKTIMDSKALEEMKRRLHTKWAGQTLDYRYETGSTNEDAKKLAEDGAPEGTLVVADFQRGGKGRLGRSWTTPHKTAIAMSLVLRPQIPPEKASMMTLVAGMATAQAVKDATGLDAQIKWPNDVVVNGKKIVGILTEMSVEQGTIRYVVIGTGMNANMTDFPEEIRTTATSLLLETGHPVDRTEIICKTMEHFETYYETYMNTRDMSVLKEEYQALLANMDRQVRVLEPENEYNGIARGINDMGELLVETSDGQLKTIYAGEVSVRGIYNYV